MICGPCGVPNDVASEAVPRWRRRRENRNGEVLGRFVGAKDWSRERRLDPDRRPCRNRRFAKKRRSSRERATGRCVGRPFFPRLCGGQGRGGITKFFQTTLDGLAVAVEKPSDIANAA